MKKIIAGSLIFAAALVALSGSVFTDDVAPKAKEQSAAKNTGSIFTADIAPKEKKKPAAKQTGEAVGSVESAAAENAVDGAEKGTKKGSGKE
ncbi:MAG: hypothetical protein U9Q90_03910 [Campylobacterota bacterium]|nr:hypothetical protein [Campylobacterota bacterium]